ncbi:hypothetical protein HK101_002118 [Irineochytrium annulatum]|nr:hypothetical protein HK101_002118 [Irineochytrium annulatum]
MKVDLELRSCRSISLVSEHAKTEGFASALVPLLNASAERRLNKPDIESLHGAPFNSGELFVPSAEWSQSVTACMAEWIDLDSADEQVRRVSETIAKQEAMWAAHLGFPTLLIPCPSHGPVFNFARCVNQVAGMLSYTNLYVRIVIDAATQGEAGWTRWNLVRSLSESNSRIGIALEIQSDVFDDSAIKRWAAEPVKIVILPSTVFIMNKKGFPVLSKRMQAFARSCMDLNIQFVVSFEAPTMESNNLGMAAYRQYLQHLHKSRPEADDVDKFASGYHDYLQSPLQPLMDNLESATYEIFEKDPVKYREYERAIGLALADRHGVTSNCIIMVVGAGRGPLVDCTLRAADATGRRVTVYAVEKNPNAIVILNSKKASSWGDRVTVFHADMRYWEAPEKADIIVSELLGSFGDNELSPECLDGAQRFLKDGGISIPQAYTTYISPLSSSKLYSEVSGHKDISHLETPYVVKFKAVNELVGLTYVAEDPAPLWSFEHPVPNLKINHGTAKFNLHNTRYGHALFEIKKDVIMHGIGGYFDAVLYKDVIISIHPKTHSEGMFSWFPLFFPLKIPIHLHAGTFVDVHFWRLCDSRKVWYEWAVSPLLTPAAHHPIANGYEEDGAAPVHNLGGCSAIHNPGGRSFWIGF